MGGMCPPDLCPETSDAPQVAGQRLELWLLLRLAASFSPPHTALGMAKPLQSFFWAGRALSSGALGSLAMLQSKWHFHLVSAVSTVPLHLSSPLHTAGSWTPSTQVAKDLSAQHFDANVYFLLIFIEHVCCYMYFLY